MANLVSLLLQVTDDGQVHGFEGVLDNSWCCPGTCTHVYNYEQTLASLARVGARQQAWDPEKTGLLSGEQHTGPHCLSYIPMRYGPESSSRWPLPLFTPAGWRKDWK